MWRRLATETLIRPRQAAREVLAAPVEVGWLLQSALAITCIGMVMSYAASALTGGAVDPVSAAVLSRPLVGAALQFGVMVLIALLTWRVGQALGGRGGFTPALLTIVWLNAITLLIQLGQLVALVLVPPLGGLIALAAFFWLLWAYANFVTELHGFDSPAIVLGVTILSLIALVFGLTLIAALLGLGPQGTP